MYILHARVYCNFRISLMALGEKYLNQLIRNVKYSEKQTHDICQNRHF